MEIQTELQTGDKIIHNKYVICNQIGEGSFSKVYSIILKKKDQNILRAVKIENDSIPQQQISTEVSVLKSLQAHGISNVGFTKLYEYGFENDYNYMVMEMLGPNIHQLLKLCAGKLSMNTVVVSGLQIVDRLQSLHNAGFIYRDIKPDNFCMGLRSKSPILHMIDFGKCRRYKHKSTGKHIPYKEKVKFDCDFAYSSINTHNNIEYSRRDDLEALINMMVYLKKGKLPWLTSQEFKTKKDREIKIGEIKNKITVEHLMYKMPLAMSDVLYYVRTLNFYEKPDYDYIRTLFYRCLKHQQSGTEMLFDWNQIESLDFAIYSGEPKICMKSDEAEEPGIFIDEADERKRLEEGTGQNQSNFDGLGGPQSSLDANLLRDKANKPQKQNQSKQIGQKKLEQSRLDSVIEENANNQENISPLKIFGL